ncbi:MAG: hypothetical protein K9N48_01930, partial [Verrucomicrobia bacterium]|nr:hypothetical protein [Verrucomicrobiota bacterium]
ISDTTQIYGPFDGNLSNAGEIIELYRPDRPQLPPHTDAGFVPYVIADKVEYTDSSPWPAEPDGNGPALSKLNPEVFGNDPTNWGAVTPTPGYAHTPDFSDILYTDESGLKLYFNGKAGYKYLIQFKDSLSDDTWQDLTTTGRLTSTHQVEITDTNTSNADARFYRLIVNPGM